MNRDVSSHPCADVVLAADVLLVHSASAQLVQGARTRDAQLVHNASAQLLHSASAQLVQGARTRADAQLVHSASAQLVQGVRTHLGWSRKPVGRSSRT